MSIPPNKKQKLDVEHLVKNILNEIRPGHFAVDNTPINLEDITIIKKYFCLYQVY